MLLYQSLQLRKISSRVEGLFNNAGWVLCFRVEEFFNNAGCVMCFKLSLVYFVSTVRKHHLHCSVISMVLKTRPGQNRFCLLPGFGPVLGGFFQTGLVPGSQLNRPGRLVWFLKP